MFAIDLYFRIIVLSSHKINKIEGMYFINSNIQIKTGLAYLLIP